MPKKSSQKQSRKLDLQRGKVVTISRSDIVADDINPRTISEENMRRLKESIRKNGLVGHPVWNRQTGHIVGGHQRIAALDAIMRSQGYELDVLEVDMPLKDEVRLNVALNQQDAQGEFDFSVIADLATDFGLDLSADFGFSDEVIEINFPEFSAVAEESSDVRRNASDDDIAKMKEAKKATRERNKEFRHEYGDFNGEPKGVLTVVFDRESAKRQWFVNHGFSEDEIPSVMHVYDFEKLFKSDTSGQN